MRNRSALALALPVAIHLAPSLSGIAPLRTMLMPGLAGRSTATTVALTFDDGPDADSTPAFLDALAELNATATFFLLGEMIERAPQIAGRIVDEGHEVAVHGWTHRNHLRLAPWTIRAEIQRTSELIEATTGQRPRFYRPPYGVISAGDVWAAGERAWDVRASLFARSPADRTGRSLRATDACRLGST